MKERNAYNPYFSGYFRILSQMRDLRKSSIFLSLSLSIFATLLVLFIFTISETIAFSRDAFIDGTQDDETTDEIGSEWILSRRFFSADPLFRLSDALVASGRVVAIDEARITIEGRDGKKRQEPRRDGLAIVLFPPIDQSSIETFCLSLLERPRPCDSISTIYGDEFSGELIKMDGRRVYFRAFGEEFTIPRYRVRAIRLKDRSDAPNERAEKDSR